MSRSKRQEGSLTRPLELEPPEVAYSTPKVQLLEPLIFLLLVADISADRLLVAPDRVHKVSPHPKVLPDKIAFALSINPRRWIALLPLMNPTTCDTAYFGGIESSMCT